MNYEEGSLVKSVALFMSFILIIAVMGWVTPIAEAADEGCLPGSDCCPPKDLSGGEKGGEPDASNEDCLNDVELTEILKSFSGEAPYDTMKIKVIDEDGNIEVTYGDDGDEPKTGKTSFDELIKLSGSDRITIGERNGQVNTRKEVLSKIDSIEIKKEGAVVYGMKPTGDNKNGGKITMEGTSYFEMSSDDKLSIRDLGKDMEVNLGDGGEINYKQGPLGRHRDTFVSYKGAGTSIKVDGVTFENVDGEEGSVQFNEDDEDDSKRGFEVKNSLVIDPRYKLQVGSEGVYMGNKDSMPDDLKKDYEERHLTLEKGKLSGNLNGIGDKEEIKLTNKGSDPLEIDGLAEGTVEKIPSGKQATFTKDEKGKVQVDVSKDSLASSKSKNSDEPDLPQAGTPSAGTDDDETPVDPKVKPDSKPPFRGGGGDNGGSGGGGMMGMIIAGLIGAVIGAILGAMLAGGGDEKSAENPYNESMINETLPKEINEFASGRGNRSVSNRPSPGPGGTCYANSSGYFNCPGDDCSRCHSIDTNVPLVQDDADTGSSA